MTGGRGLEREQTVVGVGLVVVEEALAVQQALAAAADAADEAVELVLGGLGQGVETGNTER